MIFIYLAILLTLLWIVIEIMSIVLKITGLDFYKARFQVISIITHTGFTTRESELIVQHPLRRKIAGILMVISYIAQASLISLFFGAIVSDENRMIYIVVTLVAFALFIFIITRSKYFSRNINRVVEKFISKNIMRRTKKRSIDEVLKLSSGFAVYEVLLDSGNPICGKSLSEASLKEKFIQVLKVERGTETIDFPMSGFVMQEGDLLIVYGKIQAIKELSRNG
ncbi:MAG: TrkA C-terminal domain-containing protein [Clostridia bacterium]